MAIRLSLMTIEQTILTLPSVRGFIDSVTNSVRHSSVVVLIPDTISRDMVARLIDNRLRVKRLAVGDVSYTADQVPVLSVSDQLNISWPSPSTVRNVRNLLQCEGLPNLIQTFVISARPIPLILWNVHDGWIWRKIGLVKGSFWKAGVLVTYPNCASSPSSTGVPHQTASHLESA